MNEENLKRRDHFGELGVFDGRVILKCCLERCPVGPWIQFVWLRIGSSARL
jgi:hypothetical protein